jgi:hypothetical protein
MSKEQIVYAGYSRLKGELKFRTATTEGRVHQLGRTDSDLHMIEIAPVATKAEAAKQLLALDHAKGNREVELLYSNKALDANPFAKPKARKTTVVVKVPTRFAQEVQGEAVEVSEKLTPKQAAKIRDEFNAKVKAAYEAN